MEFEMTIPEECPDIVRQLLHVLYPDRNPQECWDSLRLLIDWYDARLKLQAARRKSQGTAMDERQKMSEEDIFLITYGDIVRADENSSLDTLKRFLDMYLQNTFTTLHILPFYPYSSDDGFSVVDYKAVDPGLGNWEDIHALASGRSLMFDAVINHISSKNPWFLRYLQGDPEYGNLCIEKDPDEDYSKVVRPRTTPLFTGFPVDGGAKDLWTTFSSDQIDLNYGDFDTFLRVFDVLLFYVVQGASVLRLDAVSYLWKQAGTSCSNLDNCHGLIQLFRVLLDIASPWVVILTETNVPHHENIRYLGNGSNEAQMVYQFALPPLVAHSFMHGDGEKLSKWADSLEYQDGCAYFNFLSSHDGVGVVPVQDILDEDELRALVDRTRLEDGFISFKTLPGGEQVPYELNTTYFSLICSQNEESSLRIRKFISCQSILLALKGVPALYYHSLFGSRNDREHVVRTGRVRSVNRKKFTMQELQGLLDDTTSEASKIFFALKDLIDIRKRHSAFNPRSSQVVLKLQPTVFGLLRTSPEERIVTLVNVSGRTAEMYSSDIAGSSLRSWDIIAGDCDLHQDEDHETLGLEPYGFVWLRLQGQGGRS